MPVNHERAARIMREDNLLAIQPKVFVNTTDSDHALEVYLNLARRIQLNGIDQLYRSRFAVIRKRRRSDHAFAPPRFEINSSILKK
jgi:hypothetical protein